MKKSELIKLYKAFEQVKTFGETKFKYLILKNLKVISNEIDTLKEIEKPIQDIMQPIYNQRNELFQRIGTKRYDGYFFIDDKDYEKRNEFDKEMQIILDNNKEIVEKYNEEILKYNKILDEEFEEILQFHKIIIDDCPSNLDDNVLDLFMKYGIID